MRAGGELNEALDEAILGVQTRSTKYAKLHLAFHEAHVDENGELQLGLNLRYETAVQDELLAIHTNALQNGTRVPAEDLRTAMAERAVRTKYPQLFADYQAAKTEIEAMKLWLANQRAVISGYQSLRRAES